MDLLLNFDLEKPTLGGVLTLLAEATLLIKNAQVKHFDLYAYGEHLDSKWLDQLKKNVLRHYKYPITTLKRVPDRDGYPSERFNDKDFSYYNTNRLSMLYLELSTQPSLRWSKSLERRVSEKIRHIETKFLTIHMKYGFPLDLNLSHADPSTWVRAIKAFLRISNATLIIVGDDPLPHGLEHDNRLLTAKNLELNIAEQLYLISKSSGFVGTASGVCSGAILSTVPYIIYKSPNHHAAQMKNELGNTDKLSFAHDFQKIIRKIPSEKILVENMLSFL